MLCLLIYIKLYDKGSSRNQAAGKKPSKTGREQHNEVKQSESQMCV